MFPRVVLLGAIVVAELFLFWVNTARMARIDYVSGLVGRAEPVDVLDLQSPTGYAHGQRELIVPERNERAMREIAQTQRMLAEKRWRIHEVDAENAPKGREDRESSLGRWWVALVAMGWRAVTHLPLGVCVERAALWAPPLALGTALFGLTIFAARRFGVVSGVWVTVSLASLYPLAARFYPGAPDARAWALLAESASLLCLGAGWLNDRSQKRDFTWAGVFGGIAVALSAPMATLVVGGVFVGGLAAMLWRKKDAMSPETCATIASAWRAWSWVGATTLLALWLFDDASQHLTSLQLDVGHPVYAAAWLGAGEWLARISIGFCRPERSWAKSGAALILATAAISLVPLAAWWLARSQISTTELDWRRLTLEPGGIVAMDFKTWLHSDGSRLPLVATLVPFAAILMLLVAAFRRALNPPARAALLTLGAAGLVAFALAHERLSWWSALQVVAVAMGAIALTRENAVVSRTGRLAFSAIAAVAVALGIAQAWPRDRVGPELALTTAETQSLVERHLAHWIAKHSGEPGATVFTSPRQTAAFAYFGGLRGIGTFAPENTSGLSATLGIVAANTLEEAQTLLQERGASYVVVPSWDRFFDDFARLYLAKQFANRESLLVRELRRGEPPLWLRPVPVQLPNISGFENQSALIFEVVEEQGPAVARSRLTEYFVEMGDAEKASVSAGLLRRYPGDVAAMAARAQAQRALGDGEGLRQTLEALIARISAGGDRYLVWDRRVSLAIVLAQADRVDLARAQLQRCLADLDEKRLRSLTTGSLYSFLVLTHALEMKIADPRLAALAMELLPPDVRSQL